MRTFLAFLLFCGVAPVFAQRHEYLGNDEIDQIRLAQDPNDRLKLYLRFARERVEQAQQLVKEGKPGSSVLVHELFDQYNQIIDAIDTVSDDALERKVEIETGTKAVVAGEKELIPILEKIRDSQPKDLTRYQFVLDQAIGATRDSLEAASEDLGKRSEEVQAREKKEEQEREAVMQPKDLEEKKAAEKKEAAEKRKKPTLLKPGEKAKDQQ